MKMQETRNDDVLEIDLLELFGLLLHKLLFCSGHYRVNHASPRKFLNKILHRMILLKSYNLFNSCLYGLYNSLQR